MIVSIQYLRALAAAMVVLHHQMDHVRHHATLPALVENANAGVDIFFVVSGFIMWHTTAGRPVTPAAFLRRRAERIVPLYWLATLAMFAMPLVSGTIAGSTVADPRHLLASLLFVPREAPGFPGQFLPTYVPGWTINFEMYFYAAFAACLCLGEPRRRLVALAAAFAAVVVIGQWAGTPTGWGGVVRWYGSPIVLEFLLGVLVAAWAGERRSVPPRAALALVAAGLAAIVFIPVAAHQGLLRPVTVGLPAAALVAGAVSLERHGRVGRHALPMLVGDASYALYLTHLFAIGAVAAVWSKLGLWALPGGIAVYLALSTAAALALAVLAYRRVEQPALAWFKARRSAAAATAEGRSATVDRAAVARASPPLAGPAVR